MGALCCCGSNIDFDDEEVQLRHFYLLRVIGKGAFGKVRIVQHKSSLSEYALKYISKAKCIELNAFRNILTERTILELIDHPLIVNLRYAFHDDENIFMVLDLMLGGDLRFHLNSLGTFNELQVRFYVAELILSLSHIHRQKIVHRDIKPDNILLDDKGHAHLSDFNVATQLTSQKPYRQNRAGSLVYMAPEILLNKKYAEDVDWWSLGVMTYELLFGKRPFEGKTNEDVRKSILKNSLEFPEDIHISLECKQVIKGLLTKQPKDRLGHGEQGVELLKSHSWFQGIDWHQLEYKKAQPPFIPSKDSPNYDAIHELEELLFTEEPLRPHSIKTKLNNMEEIDTKFVPYDYTNPNKRNNPQEILTQSTTESTTTTTSIFKKLTLALLKPDICANAALPPKIKEAIINQGLEIIKENNVLWTEEQAGKFYAEHKGKFFYHRLCGYMTSGPFQALILTAPNAIKEWRSLIGPTHPVRARVNQPNTLRALYGLTDTRNSFHGSDSDESARKEIEFFFPDFFKKE
ncbi:hypothetical protein G6F29_002179 [Rhizopus arrhizus]|nr:hypothetical protein G6F23_010115 [Rhizopus arrhizus]KAG1405783.1 hypothetical protein G6F58_009956 [Rhizopus delemar]KAG0765693.1 hypothetical protein G6F24_004219 [Rhizopus arrhizus]KAG0840534.1 hypothetical protein G6F18_003624 [Rhizopus arrhizus]KAG0859499.1 hypothetical protein G6F17_001866 [Rhizopus arrhizus]